MSTAVTIRRPSGSVALPSNDQWQNRFEIRSETSNRVYIIAQNKATMLWGCSCPGYRTHRKCKHLLQGCGVTESEIHGNPAAKLDRTPESRRLR